jgi:hypothetical protein
MPWAEAPCRASSASGCTTPPSATRPAGLVALAPALRRLPALELISLYGNPFGDEGLAALVAPPPPPEGALPPPTGVLAKPKALYLRRRLAMDSPSRPVY